MTLVSEKAGSRDEVHMDHCQVGVSFKPQIYDKHEQDILINKARKYIILPAVLILISTETRVYSVFRTTKYLKLLTGEYEYT